MDRNASNRIPAEDPNKKKGRTHQGARQAYASWKEKMSHRQRIMRMTAAGTRLVNGLILSQIMMNNAKPPIQEMIMSWENGKPRAFNIPIYDKPITLNHLIL
jgi:hypothetical protein